MSKKREKKDVPPAHECWLDLSAVKQLGAGSLLDAARTVVVLRCAKDGCISHYVLPGHWTMGELGKR